MFTCCDFSFVLVVGVVRGSWTECYSKRGIATGIIPVSSVPSATVRSRMPDPPVSQGMEWCSADLTTSSETIFFYVLLFTCPTFIFMHTKCNLWHRGWCGKQFWFKYFVQPTKIVVTCLTLWNFDHPKSILTRFRDFRDFRLASLPPSRSLSLVWVTGSKTFSTSRGTGEWEWCAYYSQPSSHNRRTGLNIYSWRRACPKFQKFEWHDWEYDFILLSPSFFLSLPFILFYPPTKPTTNSCKTKSTT